MIGPGPGLSSGQLCWLIEFLLSYYNTTFSLLIIFSPFHNCREQVKYGFHPELRERIRYINANNPMSLDPTFVVVVR